MTKLVGDSNPFPSFRASRIIVADNNDADVVVVVVVVVVAILELVDWSATKKNCGAKIPKSNFGKVQENCSARSIYLRIFFLKRHYISSLSPRNSFFLISGICVFVLFFIVFYSQVHFRFLC